MREVIRIVANPIYQPAEITILKQIARDANLTINWIHNINGLGYKHILNGSVDVTSGLWVNTEERRNENLTFSYPLRQVELAFIIPDPKSNWSSAPLAVFRVFNMKLWMLMMLMASVFVTSIWFINTFKKWMRLAI